MFTQSKQHHADTNLLLHRTSVRGARTASFESFGSRMFVNKSHSGDVYPHSGKHLFVGQDYLRRCEQEISWPITSRLGAKSAGHATARYDASNAVDTVIVTVSQNHAVPPMARIVPVSCGRLGKTAGLMH